LTIELLDEFQLGGIEVLNKLHKKRKNEVDSIKGRVDNQIELQKIRLNRKEITHEQYEEELKRYNGWKQALDYSMSRWTQIFDIIAKQKDWAEKISEQSNVFKKLRDDAGIQLLVLKEIKVIDETFKVFKYLGEIVELTSNIPLLKLDKDVAEQLLGLEYKIEGEK
jgi:hypothetical protein